ncbi:sialidase family protein [Brachyspira pilosicoli]|uniref:sialidase family protein n=1 Tax=Brachyspira pilosicoli TaxID=52584 RepID=UPI0030054301
MSKKIIYLLSLLMALSLVFASCKKNSVTDALGGLTAPPDSGQGQDQAGSDGLFNSYADIPDGEIANTGVYVTTDGDYYRNPVVVARPNGTIFVFAEKRYQSSGSGNDVGIDGIHSADVIYKVSQDSGYNFNNQENIVGGKAATGPDDSHGAPVVFVNNTDIVVVATSGSGIGRTTQATVTQKPSKIEYIKGTIDDKQGTITWSGNWTEIQIDGKTIVKYVENVSAGGQQNVNFNQAATPPSRGYVDNSGNMYLDVVLAYQGDESTVYELMGRITIKGVSISQNQGSVTWTKLEDAVAYTTDSAKLGPWKETKLVSSTGETTESSYQHIVVPSPWAVPTSLRPGVLGQIAKDGTATINRKDIKASEGSVGYFITQNKWFGDKEYTINAGTTEGDGSTTISAGTSGDGTQMGILVHVQETAKNLHLYCVDQNLTVQGKGWFLDSVGKSSSVDMLADGTIVVAAEKGGAEKNYFIRLLRYSQKEIVKQTTAN